MKKIKIMWRLILDWLKIAFQFIPTLIVTGIMSYLVLVVFANKLCDDKSLNIWYCIGALIFPTINVILIIKEKIRFKGTLIFACLSLKDIHQ